MHSRFSAVQSTTPTLSLQHIGQQQYATVHWRTYRSEKKTPEKKGEEKELEVGLQDWIDNQLWVGAEQTSSRERTPSSQPRVVPHLEQI